MARQAARRKEHHVDSDGIARTREARGEHFGGGGDAAQAILVDREVEIGGAVAPFDLDERHRLPGPLLWHAHLTIAAARSGRVVAIARDRKSTRLNSSH